MTVEPVTRGVRLWFVEDVRPGGSMDDPTDERADAPESAPENDPSTPEPRKNGGRSLRLIAAILLAVLVVFGIVGGTVWAALDQSHRDAALKARINAQSATAQVYIDWLKNGGQNLMDTVASDAASAEFPRIEDDPYDNCLRLYADIQNARNYAPIPDATAQQNWDAALTGYQRFVDACFIYAAPDVIIEQTNYVPILEALNYLYYQNCGNSEEELQTAHGRIQSLITDQF